MKFADYWAYYYSNNLQKLITGKSVIAKKIPKIYHKAWKPNGRKHGTLFQAKKLWHRNAREISGQAIIQNKTEEKKYI